MGRVISLINTTPDGFVDAQYATIDAEYFEFIHGILSVTSTIAFGRNSFELFQQLWPPRLDEKNTADYYLKMARALTAKPKTVYSSTLKTTKWDNSAIVQKIDVDAINAFKQDGKGGLLTFASMQLVASLTEMNLIDDYYFCVQPIMAGKGAVRLFDKINLEANLPLIYMDSIELKSGVLIIHYQREN